MIDDNWDFIIDTIREEKCVLFLGPDILKTSDGIRFQEKLVASLDLENNDKILRYYPEEELFLFPNAISKTRGYYYKVKNLYNESVSEELLTKIAQIPFHLILSVSPDPFLRKIFEKQHFPFSYSFYPKNMPPVDVEVPSSSKPLIYNLFGSFEQEESMVLSHDDLFEYLHSVFGNQKFPHKLLSTLQAAHNIIFIGFQFHKWYLQLILRILQINNEKLSFERHAAGLSISEETRTFYKDQFNIEFVEKAYEDFINTLHQKCKDKDLIRKSQMPGAGDADHAKIYISYAWKDREQAVEDSREQIVEDICQAFESKGYEIVRDKSHLSYQDSIKSFMDQIGKGNFVIVVISDKYIKSEYCMYEAYQAFQSGDFKNRVFPVVLNDADIFSYDGQTDYVLYWAEWIDKLKEKSEKLTKLGKATLAVPLIERLKQFELISYFINDFMAAVSDMNVLSAEMHIEQNFSDLIANIQEKMEKLQQDGK